MSKHAHLMAIASVVLFGALPITAADDPATTFVTVVMDAPATDSSLVLGYSRGESEAGQYKACVIYREADGSLSLWVSVEGQPESAVEERDPEFADSVNSWLCDSGHTPACDTWELLWNGPDADGLADWAAQQEAEQREQEQEQEDDGELDDGEIHLKAIWPLIISWVTHFADYSDPCSSAAENGGCNRDCYNQNPDAYCDDCGEDNDPEGLCNQGVEVDEQERAPQDEGDDEDTDDDEDDEEEEEEEEEEEGDDCELSLILLAASFEGGNLNHWPDGAQLAPPPAGTSWQWYAGSGAVLPVVLWFGDPVEPRIRVFFNASEGCPTTMHLRARDESRVLAEVFVGSDEWPGPGAAGERTIWLDTHSPPVWGDTVGKRVRSIAFECSLDDGAHWGWFGTAQPTYWYVMPAGNALPPGDGMRYDLALDKVAQYASGMSSVSAIASAVNSGIAGEIYYDPGEGGILNGDLHILRAYEQGRLLCKYNALLMEHLTRAVGHLACVKYVWGSASINRVDYYRYSTYTVSFRAIAPQNDAAEANPHFSYHAQTMIGGAWYDPSYGTLGLVSFSELCPSYSEAVDEDGGGTGVFHYPPLPAEIQHTPVQQHDFERPSDGLVIPYTCPH